MEKSYNGDSVEVVGNASERCNEAKTREKRWCILKHPDSDMIGEIFSGKRKVYNTSEDDSLPLPPFEYFIPFDDLKNRPVDAKDTAEDDSKPYDALLDERALRSDLHHFIFICEPKEVVRKILYSPWNRVLRNSLFVYRDEHGDPLEISDAEIERFKAVIKRYDFQIVNGEPSEDVHEGDPVKIISGPMAGTDGQVTGIREKDGQVTLTIEFSMFQDKMRIAVPGISIADVRLKTQEAQQLLQDPVISHFEDELIELLCHLHGKKGSRALNKSDLRRLRFLYQYSDIVFEDNTENRAKFAALMLVCVYLMNDKKAIEQRTREVEQLLLKGKEELSIVNCQLSTELECYLMTALFIANHDPELRRKTKEWRQSHPDCLLSIRRFQSIAKQIRC